MRIILFKRARRLSATPPWTAIFTLMLIMTGLFIIHQTPAVAQTACANNRSTFSGYDTAAGQANWGTQAQIDERVSDSYCTGATDNFATSWVMWVGNNNTSGRDGYSQAGWMQMSNQGACYFGEYDPDGVGFGSAFTRAFYCPGFQFGQTILYTTQFNSNCNCAQNLAGLINVNQTNFNPLQIWSNLRNTWASETNWDQTYVPGNSISPAAFKYLYVQQPFSTNFVANTAPLTQSQPIHPGSYTGPIYFNSFQSYQM